VKTSSRIGRGSRPPNDAEGHRTVYAGPCARPRNSFTLRNKSSQDHISRDENTRELDYMVVFSNIQEIGTRPPELSFDTHFWCLFYGLEGSNSHF
jgi:hypothetical protein